MPVGEGLTLEGLLAWDDGLPLAAVEAVVICAQMLPETREAVLPRVRRMAQTFAKYKSATFCFDYRGYGGSGGSPDVATIQADRDAVKAYLRDRLGERVQAWFFGWPGPRRAELHWLEIAPEVTLPVYHYPAQGASRGTVFVASMSPEWAQMHDDLALRLVAEGYAVVGVSSLEVPERIWAATRQLVTMDQFFAAYERLWPFAQELTGDDRPLSLVGHSAGSSGNLLLAAHAGRPGAPLDSGARPGLWGRVRGIVGFGNSANKGFSMGFGEIVDEQVWQLEPYLPRVQVPVYMVQGDADDEFPAAEIEAQVRLLPGPAHFQVIPGADHEFTGQFEQLAGLVLAGLHWVEER
ncbi:MAG: Dienelactone hydrolase family [Symbiobacteriaceae bacterium]|nr:Dienelactone hydrolase family [Symbiobacteriaceae bacterium]